MNQQETTEGAAMGGAAVEAGQPDAVAGVRLDVERQAWFCVRSQPKHEHIAAAFLTSELGLEVYLPRIRFKRATRRGPVWFTEALFPNYLFARLDLSANLRQLHHGRGVSGVVHFGDQWPVVPEEVIADLRATIGDDQVHLVNNEPQEGETVEIAGGAFHGLKAVVTRVMPGRERVAVLLEFLGRQTAVELPRSLVIREANLRKELV